MDYALLPLLDMSPLYAHARHSWNAIPPPQVTLRLRLQNNLPIGKVSVAVRLSGSSPTFCMQPAFWTAAEHRFPTWPTTKDCMQLHIEPSLAVKPNGEQLPSEFLG